MVPPPLMDGFVIALLYVIPVSGDRSPEVDAKLSKNGSRISNYLFRFIVSWRLSMPGAWGYSPGWRWSELRRSGHCCGSIQTGEVKRYAYDDIL